MNFGKLKRPVSRVPLPGRSYIDYALGLFEVGAWCKAVNIDAVPSFIDRRELYAHVQRHIGEASPIDYMEFGVWQGASIRAWTELNRPPP